MKTARALFALLAVALLCAGAAWAETVASGTCGAASGAVAWVLDSDGCLTISGTGDMQNYTTDSPAPWQALRQSISEVQVEYGVTSVGDDAFYGCTALDIVWLSEDVVSIGSGAFGGCATLTDVYIPESVETIGNRAFEGCGAGFTISCAMDSGAFRYGEANNIALMVSPIYPESAVELPGECEAIQAEAFRGDGSIEWVWIPEGCTSIGSKAFADCPNLTLVTIPATVTEIAEDAFAQHNEKLIIDAWGLDICVETQDHPAYQYAREQGIYVNVSVG